MTSEALIAAGRHAGWQAVGADGRTGICLEILDRLNKQSFELAHAVMMTTGQGWMMAFQAGAPHAQDRGLEGRRLRLARAELRARRNHLGKAQGKNPPLVMKKHFRSSAAASAPGDRLRHLPRPGTPTRPVRRLATGNPVIVKPHSNAILPAAITVRTIRAVLAENGIDPNLVSLCVTDRATTQGWPPTRRSSRSTSPAATCSASG